MHALIEGVDTPVKRSGRFIVMMISKRFINNSPGVSKKMHFNKMVMCTRYALKLPRWSKTA